MVYIGNRANPGIYLITCEERDERDYDLVDDMHANSLPVCLKLVVYELIPDMAHGLQDAMLDVSR